MRAFGQTIVCAILLSGGVLADTPTSTLNAGDDFPISVITYTDKVSSCYLVTPTSETVEFIPENKSNDKYELREPNYLVGCSVTVKRVDKADNGLWEIHSETAEGWKTAKYELIVIGDENSAAIEDAATEMLQLFWTEDTAVSEVFGAENAVYCKVQDANNVVVSDAFGRCRVIIERVTEDHAGIWKIHIGLPGHVVLQEREVLVHVLAPEQKPTVITHVEKQNPSVIMSCAVEAKSEVRACKFRDPSGRILLASQGIDEDRYISNGIQVSLQANVSAHDCSLRITNPLAEDLGLWRCAMETADETYYGFLTVLCPWAMQDPAVAANVVTEPTLTAQQTSLTIIEGNSVTMSCSIQSALKYCYFRAENGTVFNVSPVLQSDAVVYAGAGFDAGECAARIPAVATSDAGRWSCHVGLMGAAPEQRLNIELTVHEPIVVKQTVVDSGTALLVTAQTAQGRPVHYCRFVRMDGLGFTLGNVPHGYTSNAAGYGAGRCELRIKHPSILEMHPWTVVAKVEGWEREVTGTTQHTIEMPGLTPHFNSFTLLWIVIILITLLMFFIGLILGPKKNREWTTQKTAALRENFRSSFRLKQESSGRKVALDQSQIPSAVV